MVLLAFLFPTMITAAIMPPTKAFTPTPVVYLNPLPDFYVDPSTIQVASGLLFNVSIYVSSTSTNPALNLYGWEASLQWDSNVLSLVSFAPGNPSYGVDGSAINSSVPEQTSQRYVMISPMQVTSPLELLRVTFQGISIGSSSINLMDVLLINSSDTSTTTYDRPSDVNGNGVVNMPDIGAVVHALFATPSSPQWNPNCDIDDNGVVDIIDLTIVASDFGRTGPPFPPSKTALNFAANIQNSSVTVSAGVHDVSVDVAPRSKTVIGQGFGMNIDVTAANQGNYTETFNVTAYANTTLIASETIALTSGSNETLAYTWNTTGFAYGNYSISAYAWPVLGETDTLDNNFTGGWVVVSLIGDITGPDGWPDGKIDMRDIGLVGYHFGETVPPAPANCDLTGPTAGVPDGKIDMRDISLVAWHFGEHYP